MVYTHLKSKCQSRFNTGSSQDLFDRDLLSDRPEMAATLGPHEDLSETQGHYFWQSLI